MTVAFVGLVLLNGISFMHAYRFTHPVQDGRWTERPGRLEPVERAKILLTGVTVPKIPNRLSPAAIGREFTSITIHGVDGVATPVWEVVTAGATCTVLMFHGYGSHKDALLPLADFLLGEHCDVVLADFPGHGDSPENWTTVGYREAGIVRDVYDHYRARSVHPLLLYGQSLGASAILGAVSRDGVSPDGLILEMPYGSLLDTARRRFELMGIPISFPFAELLVLWGGLQFGSNGFELNPVQYAKDATMPVLLLGGRNDYQVSPRVLNDIARNVVGGTETHIFENSGHEALLTAHPDEYQQVAREFLARVQTQSPYGPDEPRSDWSAS
jgi:uncharacterized protein